MDSRYWYIQELRIYNGKAIDEPLSEGRGFLFVDNLTKKISDVCSPVSFGITKR